MRYRHEIGSFGLSKLRRPGRGVRMRARVPPTGDDDALAMAVRLNRSPNLARNLRVSPLPAGVGLVIRIAAGDPQSCAFAAARTGLDEPTIGRVAALYLLIVLFDRQADAHRMLGISAGASLAEMRDHRKWLLKWLHPDKNQNPWVAGLSVRVLAAFQETSSVVAAASPEEPAALEPAPRLRRPRRRKGHIWVPLPL